MAPSRRTSRPPAPEDETRHLVAGAAAHGVDASALSIDRVELVPGVSALRYGSTTGAGSPPRVVFLHGGSQNAHTWDFVAAELRVDAVAVDLPGHGSSRWLSDHDYSPRRLVAPILEALSPFSDSVDVLVGMSLGGMVSLGCAHGLPWIRHLVLVDVSPGSVVVEGSEAAEAARLAAVGEDSFEELVEAVSTLSAGRPRAAVEHGVWHNTAAAPSGLRRWRKDPDKKVGSFLDLWPDLIEHRDRITCVAAGSRSFIPPPDRAALESLLPGRFLTIEGATHSVQSTRPIELARVLEAVLARP